ncbi:hypothetical protein AAVH_12187 [Aphelenchoides avenae]|nr:hypothetical protein AAVH_12187 [Aphelenchus avenae]
MLPPLPPYSPLKSQPSQKGSSQKTPSKPTVDAFAPSTSASVRPRILATPTRKSPKASDIPVVEESVVEPMDDDLVPAAVDPSESRPASAAAKAREPGPAIVPARIRRERAIRQRYMRRAFGGMPDQVQVTRAAREFLQRCNVAPRSPLKFVEPLEAWHAAPQEPFWDTLFV